MPVLELDNIIKEYYETIKDEYPHVSLDKLIKICKAPFWFFNKSIARPDLPTVHIKYLGKFIVLPTRIRTLLNENDYQLKIGRIDKEEYERRKTRLNNILKEIETDAKQTMEIASESDDES